MCGRFTLQISPEALAKGFDLEEVPLLEPRYNIAPGQPIAAIRHIGDRNKLDFLKWGLVPSWSKDPERAPINARSETVIEKPTFRHAIKYNRCIIPASGFYEWKVTGDTHKQPYYIRFNNNSIMGFAGIWEKWTAENGSEMETCCILTTVANEVMKPIHDRMPVILSHNDYNLWLNRNMHDPYELVRLYEPYPSDHMTTLQVPTLVNNPRFDSPSCIIQV